MPSIWVIPLALVVAINLRLIAAAVMAYRGTWSPPSA
jgi:hypothetical protein